MTFITLIGHLDMTDLSGSYCNEIQYKNKYDDCVLAIHADSRNKSLSRHDDCNLWLLTVTFLNKIRITTIINNRHHENLSDSKSRDT